MDSEMSPEYYRDASAAQALKDTEATVAHMLKIDPGRDTISPIVTPRFAPSCSSQLLQGLGDLAKMQDLPIQTHISENPSECALVASLFPAHPHYAGVYEAHGLLTPRTVLAHAVHLSASERKLVKKRGCGISHCPVSNTSLSSGLCPVRQLLDEGIEVGLGTDVSGGYSSSILVAAREAGMVSRIVAALHKNDEVDEGRTLAVPAEAAADAVGGLMDAVGLEKRNQGGKGMGAGAAIAREDLPVAREAVADAEPAMPPDNGADRKKLSVEECLYLSTLGGAKCLGLGAKIGTFEVGKMWDAQLIEVEEVPEDHEEDNANDGVATGATIAPGKVVGERARDWGLVEVWGKETWEEKVAKWVVCGDDRNTRTVFVGGRVVHQRR